MKKKEPLVVIVKNRPTLEEAKKKINEISKVISAVYSQEIRRDD